MPKVFISHSNQDCVSTLFVVDSLKRAGFDVWVDFENIRGGTDWLCEIQAGITRCDAVVIVLSKASAQSVWVERECLYAFQLNKPVFTALFSDILIPLHLINIQYCDLRAQPAAGMCKLVESLKFALRPDTDASQYAIDAVSSQPSEANFFPYVKQLPGGDVAMLVARDLFYWSREVADEVAFGGKVNPGYQARFKLNRQMATVFSVRAYRRRPSVQLPLDYLAGHKPYDRKMVRAKLLRKLNQLLPKAERFAASKADRRPTFALHHLSSAEKLEAFKLIVLDMMSDLRAATGDS